MDELEFQRVLHLFPVVRPRDFQFQVDSQSSGKSSQSAQIEELKEAKMEGRDIWIQGFDQSETFWKNLKLAAAEKVGAAEAAELCKTFHQIYMKLVHEELSVAAARSFINSSKDPGA